MSGCGNCAASWADVVRNCWSVPFHRRELKPETYHRGIGEELASACRIAHFVIVLVRLKVH
jgi:hypothetical protein